MEECACSAAAAGTVDERLAAARSPAPPAKTLRREVAVTVEVGCSFMASSWLGWLIVKSHLVCALSPVPALHV